MPYGLVLYSTLKKCHHALEFYVYVCLQPLRVDPIPVDLMGEWEKALCWYLIMYSGDALAFASVCASSFVCSIICVPHHFASICASSFANVCAALFARVCASIMSKFKGCSTAGQADPVLAEPRGEQECAAAGVSPDADPRPAGKPGHHLPGVRHAQPGLQGLPGEWGPHDGKERGLS